jgi:hypothetical protein
MIPSLQEVAVDDGNKLFKQVHYLKAEGTCLVDRV